MNTKTLHNNRSYPIKPVCYNVDSTIYVLPDTQDPGLALSTWPVYAQLVATVHMECRDIATIPLEFHSRVAKASTQHFAPEIRHFLYDDLVHVAEILVVTDTQTMLRQKNGFLLCT